MSDERLFWIGVGLMAGVTLVFAGRLSRVLRGRLPAAALRRDAPQDTAFLCLGAALVFPGGSTGRVAVMAAGALILAALLVKRILKHRSPARRG